MGLNHRKTSSTPQTGINHTLLGQIRDLSAENKRLAEEYNSLLDNFRKFHIRTLPTTIIAVLSLLVILVFIIEYL
jgi:hypothetical protein